MHISWNAEQLRALSAMDTSIDYLGDLTDDDLNGLYDIVPDYLFFDKNGNPDKETYIVESIITDLANVMSPRGLFD